MTAALRPIRVLIVDDDEKIQRLFQMFLRQQGYKSEAASSSREALRRMQGKGYDILIVDVYMPDMDGMELARCVRTLWPWQEIVFCTGNINDKVRKAARSYGVQHLLEKPLTFNTMQSTLRQIVDLKEANNQDSLLFNQQLQVELAPLRELNTSVLVHRNFQQALAECAPKIADLIPCAAAAVLGEHNGIAGLYVDARQPISNKALDDLGGQMRKIYEELNNGELSDACRQRYFQKRIREELPTLTQLDQRLLFAPVTGKRNLLALIAVVLPHTFDQPPEEYGRLQLAAHHLSTLITALDCMEDLAMHDPLTGLFNRRYFDESMEREWLLAERDQRHLGLLRIDINDLANINVRHGYRAGDLLLQRVGRQLLDKAEPGQLVIHAGQDDFMVLINGQKKDQIIQYAEQIRKLLQEIELPSEYSELQPSFSIGVAISGPSCGISSTAELLSKVEQAVEEAQKQESSEILIWQDHAPVGTESEIKVHPVLLVDDDPQVHHLMKRVLNKNMYEITSTLSVREAVALLESGQEFHMMMTDLAIPGEDGTVMLREAKRIRPDMPCIVISGNISRSSETQLVELGAFEILQKPFQFHQLRNAAGKALEKFNRAQNQALPEEDELSGN